MQKKYDCMYRKRTRSEFNSPSMVGVGREEEEEEVVMMMMMTTVVDV